jgi:hypothetical protein
VAWSGCIDIDNTEIVYEEGQPVLVCSAGQYDHHERFTGETLSNLT